jgi:hypothetical protein
MVESSSKPKPPQQHRLRMYSSTSWFECTVLMLEEVLKKSPTELDAGNEEQEEEGACGLVAWLKLRYQAGNCFRCCCCVVVVVAAFCKGAGTWVFVFSTTTFLLFLITLFPPMPPPSPPGSSCFAEVVMFLKALLSGPRDLLGEEEVALVSSYLPVGRENDRLRSKPPSNVGTVAATMVPTYLFSRYLVLTDARSLKLKAQQFFCFVYA